MIYTNKYKKNVIDIMDLRVQLGNTDGWDCRYKQRKRKRKRKQIYESSPTALATVGEAVQNKVSQAMAIRGPNRQ
jgi:hypothetical protein